MCHVYVDMYNVSHANTSIRVITQIDVRICRAGLRVVVTHARMTPIGPRFALSSNALSLHYSYL